MWNPLRPKYPKKTYKNKYPAEKKKKFKKKSSFTVRQGHIKHVCKISGLSLKNGVDIGR